MSTTCSNVTIPFTLLGVSLLADGAALLLGNRKRRKVS